MADERAYAKSSSPRFCVVTQQSMRVQREPRSKEEANAAVQLFKDEGLLNALEDMIKVARAGKLENAAALAAQAAPW